MNIMKISKTSGDIGRIYFDYNTGTIRFSLYGNSSEAFYAISDMDSSFHIVATYNAGILSLFVNGNSGISGLIDSTNLFLSNNKNSSKVYFVFEPSSLNNSKYFLINSISFYNYPLSENQCKNRLTWGLKDDNPKKLSDFNSSSYFDETDTGSSFVWSRNFKGNEFAKNSTISNLTVTGNGLIANSTGSGYWQTIIPIVTDPLSIIASKITWNSMDNCVVKTSIDNGTTWTTQYKDNIINYVTPQTISGNTRNILLQVILPSSSISISEKQYFDDLKIYLYSNNQKKSNDKKYTINPLTDSSGTHSFINKSHDKKIITIPEQFGLHFHTENSLVPGYAQITQSSSTLYGIEFWAKYDEIFSGQNYMLDSDTGGGVQPNLIILLLPLI